MENLKRFAAIIIDTVREPLLLLSSDHRVICANSSFYKVFNLLSKDTVGRLLYELDHRQWDIPKLHELLGKIILVNSHIQDFQVNFEFSGFEKKAMNLNGRKIPLDSESTYMILLSFEDVTGRKHTAEAISSEQEFRQTIENSMIAGLVVCDLTGRLTHINDAFTKMVGWNEEELLGQAPPYVFWHPGDVKHILGNFQTIMESTQKTGSFEHTLHKKNGEIFEALIQFSQLKDGEGKMIGWLATASDITERKSMEKALRESEERLRHFSRKLLSAQEEERKRIAHELHDSIGQYLTTIKLRTESLLQKNRNAGNKMVAEPLGSLVNLIDRSIEESRRIQLALRPTILDDLGILAAISWLSREFQIASPDIRMKSEISLQEQDVPDHLKTTVFRILQEALNNIVKHSKADLVRFSFEKNEGSIEMTIQDNGRGFDVNEVLSLDTLRRGLGLPSIRERAEISQGCISIESIIGRGTSICVSWSV